MFTWTIRTLGLLLTLWLPCEAWHLVPFDVYEASFPVHEKIVKDLVRQHKLHLLTVGGNMLIGRNESLSWAFWATDSRQMTLEEGKKLARDIVQETMRRTQNDPVFIRALENCAELYPGKASLDVHPGQFGFRIAFWNANVERPTYPYLAQIVARSKGVSFYYADPQTQALIQPPETLSYDELLNSKSPVPLTKEQQQCCHEIASQVCDCFLFFRD